MNTATRIGVALLSLPALSGIVLAADAMSSSTAPSGGIHADRCEPDEIVLRRVDPDYESKVDDLVPTCAVFDGVIYPVIGCNDTTTFLRCVLPNPGPDPL